MLPSKFWIFFFIPFNLIIGAILKRGLEGQKTIDEANFKDFLNWSDGFEMFFWLSFSQIIEVITGGEFDLTNVSESIESREIPSPRLEENTGSKFYLRL